MMLVPLVGKDGTSMARKKQQTYNDMVRAVEEAQKNVISKRNHIAAVIGEELDYATAAILGDFSDAKLRCVARLMFSRAKMFANLVELNTPNARQFQDAEEDSPLEGELRYNPTKICWEIWDPEANQLIGQLRDGMCLDLLNGGNWVPAKVGVAITENWFVDAGKDVPGTIDGFIGLFDGLYVRLH